VTAVSWPNVRKPSGRRTAFTRSIHAVKGEGREFVSATQILKMRPSMNLLYSERKFSIDFSNLDLSAAGMLGGDYARVSVPGFCRGEDPGLVTRYDHPEKDDLLAPECASIS